jgi:hypothetical protein
MSATIRQQMRRRTAEATPDVCPVTVRQSTRGPTSLLTGCFDEVVMKGVGKAWPRDLQLRTTVKQAGRICITSCPIVSLMTSLPAASVHWLSLVMTMSGDVLLLSACRWSEYLKRHRNVTDRPTWIVPTAGFCTCTWKRKDTGAIRVDKLIFNC